MASIYVASLSDYNAGVMFGDWFDLTQYVDAQELTDAVEDMLLLSPTAIKEGNPAEEWAIHDYEGFGGVRISEWEAFDLCYALSEALVEHGDGLAAYLESESSDLLGSPEDLDDLISRFEEAFVGETTLEDYAYEYVNDCVFDPSTPETIRSYFDYQSFARDMGYEGYSEVYYNYSTFVFRPI